MLEIDDRNYAEVVEKNPGLIVLDFGATWCQPCKKLEPILEELTAVYEGRALIAHCDVAKGPATAQRFKVMSVPTVVFLKKGEMVDRFIGLQSRAKVVEMIDKNI
ncbi:MAG: thioredoxin fold domain-containing protein [Candidatus Eisenbacteria bacterium]|nr:thioredoxin fold domain-containing protein [Candidatus Eisenbacteria bacterium]